MFQLLELKFQKKEPTLTLSSIAHLGNIFWSGKKRSVKYGSSQSHFSVRRSRCFLHAEFMRLPSHNIKNLVLQVNLTIITSRYTEKNDW